MTRAAHDQSHRRQDRLLEDARAILLGEARLIEVRRIGLEPMGAGIRPGEHARQQAAVVAQGIGGGQGASVGSTNTSNEPLQPRP